MISMPPTTMNEAAKTKIAPTISRREGDDHGADLRDAGEDQQDRQQ